MDSESRIFADYLERQISLRHELAHTIHLQILPHRIARDSEGFGGLGDLLAVLLIDAADVKPRRLFEIVGNDTHLLLMGFDKTGVHLAMFAEERIEVVFLKNGRTTQEINLNSAVAN